MRIEIEEVGQLAIAATAQLERLQSGIQAALLLVQQTVEQEDGGFHFLLGSTCALAAVSIGCDSVSQEAALRTIAVLAGIAAGARTGRCWDYA
jgi:hypothetical protein